MSGTITTITAAIETRLTALGFAATDEVFDFDAVPSSIVNKAYRIESRRVSCEYHMNHLTEPTDEIAVSIAYKMLRNARTVWKTAMDDRESIEKDLLSAAGINGLSSNPLLSLDQDATAAKERDGFLVSRLVFRCNYLRSITP